MITFYKSSMLQIHEVLYYYRIEDVRNKKGKENKQLCIWIRDVESKSVRERERERERESIRNFESNWRSRGLKS